MIAPAIVSPSHACPGCGDLDWSQRHAHSHECVACGALVHRFDASSPWEFVPSRKRRAGQRATDAVASPLDSGWGVRQ